LPRKDALPRLQQCDEKATLMSVTWVSDDPECNLQSLGPELGRTWNVVFIDTGGRSSTLQTILSAADRKELKNSLLGPSWWKVLSKPLCIDGITISPGFGTSDWPQVETDEPVPVAFTRPKCIHHVGAKTPLQRGWKLHFLKNPNVKLEDLCKKLVETDAFGDGDDVELELVGGESVHLAKFKLSEEVFTVEQLPSPASLVDLKFREKYGINILKCNDEKWVDRDTKVKPGDDIFVFTTADRSCYNHSDLDVVAEDLSGLDAAKLVRLPKNSCGLPMILGSMVGEKQKSRTKDTTKALMYSLENRPF